jgi:putative transposase
MKFGAKIAGERVWICGAVDDEGQAMNMIVPKRRDAGAALRRMRRLFKNQSVYPQRIVTDGPRSCGVALQQAGPGDRRHHGGLRGNNGAGNSFLIIRRRELKMQGFKC